MTVFARTDLVVNKADDDSGFVEDGQDWWKISNDEVGFRIVVELPERAGAGGAGPAGDSMKRP